MRTKTITIPMQRRTVCPGCHKSFNPDDPDHPGAGPEPPKVCPDCWEVADRREKGFEVPNGVGKDGLMPIRVVTGATRRDPPEPPHVRQLTRRRGMAEAALRQWLRDYGSDFMSTNNVLSSEETELAERLLKSLLCK